MHGKHSRATNPSNLAPVACATAMVSPSPTPGRGQDVMRFGDSFNDKQVPSATPSPSRTGSA